MVSSKHKTMPPDASRARRWSKNIVDMVGIVLIVLAAKTAIAEPFYVPSGSMEPTLLIGDELLAMKFPYGYSTASLPAFIDIPGSRRVLGSLPRRGDVVVFRWPGDPSQVWVKRVIGLPGDRIAMRDGQVFINGQAAALKPDGTGTQEADDGSQSRAHRFIETLPGGRTHPIFKLGAGEPLDNLPEVTVPPGHLFVMGDNRRRRWHAAGGEPGRARGRDRRLLGSRHGAPPGLDLAAGLAVIALLHRGPLSAIT
jgi:signal peptidase I